MASRSAREVAYETIRSRIITMDLKPGDELNDRELAQELGISRTPMREALIMLNIAHMVVIKPQSGTHVAPIDLKLMEMEQFARFTLEKEILNRIRGRLTAEQEAAYRLNLESYRQLERDPDAENRETRMLDLDNAFHRRAFQLCGMEEHFDHMLSTFQHIERLRKFSLQTEENKSVCAATPASSKPSCAAPKKTSAAPSATTSTATSSRWSRPASATPSISRRGRSARWITTSESGTTQKRRTAKSCAAFCYALWFRGSDLLDGDAPLAGHGLIDVQHLVLTLFVDAVGPAVPGLHADKVLGILLPEHALVEGLVSVHSDLVAVALVGEGHGELNTGQQADGVVCALLAGEGDLLGSGGLLILGVLGAGGALDVEVHVLQSGSMK